MLLCRSSIPTTPSERLSQELPQFFAARPLSVLIEYYDSSSIHRVVKDAAASLVTPADCYTLQRTASQQHSIETLRTMLQHLACTPFGCGHLFIIEQADCLSIPAMHCLLKTLEEPPDSTLFILTAPRHHTLEKTITSRCVRRLVPPSHTSTTSQDRFVEALCAGCEDRQTLLNDPLLQEALGAWQQFLQGKMHALACAQFWKEPQEKYGRASLWQLCIDAWSRYCSSALIPAPAPSLTHWLSLWKELEARNLPFETVLLLIEQRLLVKW